MTNQRLNLFLSKVSFVIKEILFRNRYMFLAEHARRTRIIINNVNDDKSREDAKRLLSFIDSVHSSNKRKRIVNHFKTVKTNGKRKNAQWNRF